MIEAKSVRTNDAYLDGFVSTTLDLNGELSAGMYMVSIAAGDRAITERLVIQP